MFSARITLISQTQKTSWRKTNIRYENDTHFTDTESKQTRNEELVSDYLRDGWLLKIILVAVGHKMGCPPSEKILVDKGLVKPCQYEHDTATFGGLS